MIGAELVIPKDMFSIKQLVGPVFKKAGGIFQTVDIMATGPDLEISKVGAEAYFVRNTDFFCSIFSFPKKCIDIGTLSVFVQNVTKSFAIGPYSTADSRRIPQHPHWITGRGKGVDNDVLFFRFKVFLLGIIGKSAFLGHGETAVSYTHLTLPTKA